VAKGDTLYSISKKYNIPIDDLKRNNRLENDALAIGQTINILK
jgi:LysM repeat protein